MPHDEQPCIDEGLMDALDEQATPGEPAPKTPKRAQAPMNEGRESPPNGGAVRRRGGAHEPRPHVLLDKHAGLAVHGNAPPQHEVAQHGAEHGEVEAATASRLQNVEEKLEKFELLSTRDVNDASARTRISELEATIKRMDVVFKQFQNAGLPKDTAQAPPASSPGTSDNLVIIGGFKRDTPRDLLEEAGPAS